MVLTASQKETALLLYSFALGGRKNVANLNELCSKCYKGFTAESSGHTIGTIRLFMQPSNANNSISQIKSYRHAALYLKVEMNGHKY